SANNTFETTSFANPTNSLTINRGNASDSMTISAIPDFTRSLAIGTLANLFGAISISGDVSLASDSSLNAFASSDINLGANISLASGAMTLNTGGAIIQSSATVSVGGTLTVQAGAGKAATFTTPGNQATQLVIPSGVSCIVNGSF